MPAIKFSVRLTRSVCALVLLFSLSRIASAQSNTPPPPASVPMEPYANQIEQQRTDTANAQMMDRIYAENEKEEKFAEENYAKGLLPAANLLFFPAAIPPLGGSLAMAPGSDYPATLAEYAGESFFMAYGGQRFQGLITPRFNDRIQQYRANRDRLIEALRTKLSQLQATAWPQRQPALTAFAAHQETDLRKLEVEAEAIRTTLCLADEGAALVKRRDALQPDQPSSLREFLALTLAAQYHAGLSLEQRQLLSEIASDNLLAAPAKPTPMPFFLPAGARIPWPDRLPPEGVSRLARFHELRSAVKSELRAHVLETLEKSSGPQRTKRYTALAKQQAPRWAELHMLAEEIRVEFADQFAPEQPPESPLPADLVQRVGQALDRNARLKHAANRHLRDFSQALAPEQVRFVAASKMPQLETVPSSVPKAMPPSRAHEAMLIRLQTCNAQLREEYKKLAAEMEAVRTQVRAYCETLDAASAPTTAQLTTQLARTYTRLENWKRFRDYHTAALTPGLSPAQRRLLLNASLVVLEKHRLEMMD